jgi:hypothetical protein
MVIIICLSVVVVVTKGDEIHYLPTLKLFHTQKFIHALFFVVEIYIDVCIFAQHYLPTRPNPSWSIVLCTTVYGPESRDRSIPKTFDSPLPRS